MSNDGLQASYSSAISELRKVSKFIKVMKNLMVESAPKEGLLNDSIIIHDSVISFIDKSINNLSYFCEVYSNEVASMNKSEYDKFIKNLDSVTKNK